MQRRITQMFTDLFPRNRHDHEVDMEASDDSSELNRAMEEQLLELREQTEIVFKNLYWTRVVSVEHYQADELKSWPMAPDLAEEYDALFIIDEDGLPELQAHFDPAVFTKTNP